MLRSKGNKPSPHDGCLAVIRKRTPEFYVIIPTEDVGCLDCSPSHLTCPTQPVSSGPTGKNSPLASGLMLPCSMGLLACSLRRDAASPSVDPSSTFQSPPRTGFHLPAILGIAQDLRPYTDLPSRLHGVFPSASASRDSESGRSPVDWSSSFLDEPKSFS